MKPLHPWNVSIKEAIQIQEALRNRVIVEKTIHRVELVGGADVAYSKDGNSLIGAIVVLTFPEMETVDIATAAGEVPFPYIPGLLSFREGPILLRTFQLLKVKPEVMIFDGQGIAHPRGLGLASHLGLWLNLPSIGCAKTHLIGEFTLPHPLRGSFELIRKQEKELGAVLRTKDNVKPLFISPGNRIDIRTSIRFILETCKGFRIPEPLRRADHISHLGSHLGQVLT